MQLNNFKKILIIAGEASGDMHAATLVKNLREKAIDLQFFGMGGEKMQAQGVKIIQNINQLALVGLTEVIRHFPLVYRAFKTVQHFIEQQKPGLVILIDYPGFNLRLAKIAKNAGCKVFYYISPQLWAWHQSRVGLIKKYVDIMAVIFPFEVDFYKQHSISAYFVGHPLVEKVKPKLSVDEAKKLFNLQENRITIGLLPGSRNSEIRRLLPILNKTAKILKNKINAQFILPLAPTLKKATITALLDSELDVKIVTQQMYDVINVCDALIVTSGTATLETTLLEKPMAIIYKSSWLNAILFYFVKKVKFLGIANIIAGKEIVKEFLQHRARPTLLADEIQKILADEEYRNNMIKELNKIKRALNQDQQTELSHLVLSFLSKPKEAKQSNIETELAL